MECAIDAIEAQRQRLYKQLLRCNLQPDQTAPDTLRLAIDMLSRTIELLCVGKIGLRDLHTFHIRVHVPWRLFAEPVVFSVRLAQNGGHMLPLRHYFELVPPVGDSVFTPRIAQRRRPYCFECEFAFPHTAGKVLARSNILVRLWHYCPAVARGTNDDIIAIAAVPLQPLRNSPEMVVPCYFMTLGGVLTEFALEMMVASSRTLRRPRDIDIDENVWICPDAI